MTTFGYFQIADWRFSISKVRELGQAGATTVFVDETASVHDRGPENLAALESQLASGDTLIVHSLYDVVSQPNDLVEFLAKFLPRDVSIQFLDCVWASCEAPAQIELIEMIKGLAGLSALKFPDQHRAETPFARLRGRPGSLSDIQKLEVLRISQREGNANAALSMGISVATVERIRKASGMTRINFSDEVLSLVRRLGIAEASKKLGLPSDIVEYVWESSQVKWEPDL